MLIPAAELFYEEVLPTLSTDDIIHIIEDPQQSMAYRFMVIDTYSLAAQESRARSIDSAEVDEALSALINPDSGLSIMAMSSFSNPAAVVENQLKTLIEDGSDGEQVISLKLLCNQYANDA